MLTALGVRLLPWLCHTAIPMTQEALDRFHDYVDRWRVLLGV